MNLKTLALNASLIGPGKLTKKLGIDKKLNGKKSSRATGLWIENIKNKQNIDTQITHDRIRSVYTTNRKKPRNKLRIIKTPRIGVSYAGPVWSKKLYRFVLSGFETKKN